MIEFFLALQVWGVPVYFGPVPCEDAVGCYRNNTIYIQNEMEWQDIFLHEYAHAAIQHVPIKTDDREKTAWGFVEYMSNPDLYGVNHPIEYQVWQSLRSIK